MHQPIVGPGLCACGCGKPALRSFAHGHSRHNGPVEFRRRITAIEPTERGCLEWPGPFDSAGYGSWGGQKVHRIMFEHRYGPVPKGLGVLHRCDNPPCCNPEHLFAGTQQINVDDMVAKGRAPSSVHRLRPEDVREIRRRYSAGEATMNKLADDYGISRTHSRCIIRRLRWVDLP